MRTFCHFLLVLTLCAAVPTPGSAYDPKDDEAALKELNLGTDGKSLVQYFRNLILPRADREKVLAIIKQLGDDSYSVREEASRDLMKLGPAIVPLLKLYESSSDPEVAQRVQECLVHVRKSSTEHLVSAAARLIGHRKPPEAATVLLEYAPYVKDPIVEDAFRDGLSGVVTVEGKPNPVIMEAVKSEKEMVRRLAKSVLVANKAVDLETAKQYLKDDSALIRLRVALSLVYREEKSVMPTFIKLLSDVPEDNAWEVDVVLYLLAGDSAPKDAQLGTTKASREKARDLWLDWWKANSEKIKLADLNKRPPFRGWTLVSYQDNRGQGCVVELDRNNKKRWELTGLSFPIDAQLLPNRNVIVAEMNRARISEWNTQTKNVVWEYPVSQPVAVEQLKNGTVMIANLQELIVVNKQTKKVLMRYNVRQQGRGANIYGARAMPNGWFVVSTSRSEVVFIDATGKEKQRHTVAGINNYNSLYVLPNNNVLVPLYSRSQIVELTPQGKQIWNATVRYPTAAFRLPNGNTLVSSTANRNVVELTKGANPQTVKAISVDGTPWCVRRR